jgi:ankyrin repeat protein
MIPKFIQKKLLSQAAKNRRLIAAASQADVAKLQRALEIGAVANTTDAAGRTALQLAAESRTSEASEAVTTLLDAGAKIDAADRNGDSALHTAAASGNFPTANLLLNRARNRHLVADASPGSLEAELLAARNSSESQTPLHVAANRGYDDVVQLFLGWGADPKAQDAKGRTALHLAAGGGQYPVAKLLTAARKNTETRDSYGKTALHHAIHSRRYSIVKLLLDRGYDPNKADGTGERPLHIATQMNDAKLLELLLDCKRTDLNGRDKEKRTALHLAAKQQESLPVVKSFVGKGATIGLVNRNGDSVLHIALAGKQRDLVNYLIDQATSADLNARDKAGRTALHVATEQGTSAVVRRLLQKGVPINAADAVGNTSLHVAVLYDRRKVADLLLKAGADANLVNTDGKKALALAADPKVFECLNQICRARGASDISPEKLPPLTGTDLDPCEQSTEPQTYDTATKNALSGLEGKLTNLDADHLDPTDIQDLKYNM